MPRFLWPAGSGAGATCPPDWINVTCAPYNAVGDDSTDDTGAIVAAAAAAQAAPNGPVPLYFPAGTYIYNGGVAGVTLSLGAIFGDGPGLSIIRELTPLGGATPSFALIDQGGSAWDMGFELGTNAPCLLVALQGTGGRMVGCSVSDAISTADTTTMVSVEAAGCNITDCTITGNGQLIVGTLGSCTENAYLITKGCHFRCDASTDFAVTLAGPGAIIGDCTWDGTATNGLLLSGGNASAHACLLGSAALEVTTGVATVGDCQCGDLDIRAGGIEVSNSSVSGNLNATGNNLIFTGSSFQGDIVLDFSNFAGTVSFVNCQFGGPALNPAIITVSTSPGVAVPLRLSACDLLGCDVGGAIDLAGASAIPLLLLEGCQFGFPAPTADPLVSGTTPTNSIVSGCAFVNCTAAHALSFVPTAAAANVGTL